MSRIGKYKEIVRINFVGVVHHSMNLFTRSGIVLLRVWIFTQFYQATFSAYNSTSINGLSVAMVIWMLVLTQSFQASSRPPVSRMIDEEVKTGTLAYSLNRPYSYPLFHYFAFLGRALPGIALMVASGIVAAMVLVGPIAIGLEGILLGTLMLVLGLTIDFIISLMIGLSAFWIEDTSAFMWLFHKGFVVFGGAIIPLALFPASVKLVAERLPFAMMYYAPARMIVGFDRQLFVEFLLVQVFWILMLGSCANLMFRKGVRYVSVSGG